jgi:hypothetical protein
MFIRPRHIAIAMVMSLAAAGPSAAQAPRPMHFDVVAKDGGRSLAGAIVVVRIAATGVVVLTDTTVAGRLLAVSLPTDRVTIETRALGFSPDTTLLDVGRAGGSTLRIELADVVRLPDVEVKDAAYRGRLGEFERRRATGKGTFLTREDLRRKGQNRLVDALRGVRGLRVDCRATCYIRMIRSTNCEPRIYLDGFPSDNQAVFTPILDVGGVEIYHGPSETPGEFLGSNSMCGVIAIWTNAGPPGPPR